MSPLLDKQPNHLLVDTDNGQTYSDAPLQRLWRPESSTESPASSAGRRGRAAECTGKRGKLALVLGAFALAALLLMVWLLLFLSAPPTSSPAAAAAAATTTTTTTTFGTTKLQMNGNSTKMPRKHHRQQHHHVVIHVTAPTTTTPKTATTTSDRSTATTKAAQKTLTMFERLDIVAVADRQESRSDETQQRERASVVAQLEKGIQKGWATTLKTPKTTGRTFMATTSKPTTSRATTLRTAPSSRTRLTSTSRGVFEDVHQSHNLEQYTTPKIPLGSSVAEEEEDDDLFWMRDRNWRPDARAEEQKPAAGAEVEVDDYNVKRPTIEFGPVQAKEVAGEGQQSEREKQRVQEELNEIIAGMERAGEEDILPVVIRFDPVGAPPGPEPVWRRPPPDEKAHPRPPVTPPPPPAHPAQRPFSISATVQSVPKSQEEKLIEKFRLRRRRRDAPVLVTALIDIGRGEWQRFTRHYDQYLGFLANILSRLHNYVVIYCDPTAAAYLRGLGDQLDWERLQIVEISLRELPFFRQRDKIESIMKWEKDNWNKEWDVQMRGHPETTYPDYDILVNSKPYFLYNATRISHFPKPSDGRIQFFAWVDAGYGHGSTSAIPSGVWSPQLKAGKIHVVQLTPKVERVERYTLDKVYRKQKSVVSGGFLTGDVTAIQRFAHLFQDTFYTMLDNGMVDDDQTTLMLVMRNFSSDFAVLHGGWFDAFKLLPSQ